MLVSSLPRWVAPLLALDAEVRAFVEFAEKCSHWIINGRGAAVCNRRDSAPGECDPAFCSLSKFEKGTRRGTGWTPLIH